MQVFFYLFGQAEWLLCAIVHALWQIRQPCDWQTENMVFTLVKGLDISHANSNLIAI